MPLEDIYCPQFVDFTTQEPFELYDGADICFEKRVVGEETDLGFFGSSSSSDEKFSDQMKDVVSGMQHLKKNSDCDSSVANKVLVQSDQNSKLVHSIETPIVSKSLIVKENKENISGASMSKVGSALDMIYYSKNNSTPAKPIIHFVENKDQQPKHATPLQIAHHNDKNEKQSANTSVLSQDKSSHVRTVSTTSAKTASEKSSSSMAMYKGIRFLPKQMSSYSNGSNDSYTGTPSKEKEKKSQKEASNLLKQPNESKATENSSNNKLDEIMRNRPEALSYTHQPRIIKQPLNIADKKQALLSTGLTRSTHGKSASFKQHSSENTINSKPQRQNLIATLKSSFMRPKQQTQQTPIVTKPVITSHTAKLTSHKSDRDLSSVSGSYNEDSRLHETTANGSNNDSKLLSSFSHLRKKSENKAVGGFLHTEIRALKRSEYDQQMKEKEKLGNQMRHELEMEKLRKQQEEVANLRNKSNFKVQPIKQYKPIEIKPSEKPLTDPKSPQFLALSGTHMQYHGSKSNLSNSSHRHQSSNLNQ